MVSKGKMPKDHLLVKFLNIKCPINTLSESPHTVTFNILPMIQRNSQSICKESDVLENALYFTMENNINYLSLHSGIYPVCIRAHNSLPPHSPPPTVTGSG